MNDFFLQVELSRSRLTMMAASIFVSILVLTKLNTNKLQQFKITLIPEYPAFDKILHVLFPYKPFRRCHNLLEFPENFICSSTSRHGNYLHPKLMMQKYA